MLTGHPGSFHEEEKELPTGDETDAAPQAQLTPEIGKKIYELKRSLFFLRTSDNLDLLSRSNARNTSISSSFTILQAKMEWKWEI